MRELLYILGAAILVGIPLGVVVCTFIQNDLAPQTVVQGEVVAIPPSALEDIREVSVSAGEEVSFPFTVRGEARGFWFFEGSAPLYVVDERDVVVGSGFIEAEGDWMTERFVPFSGTVSLRGEVKRGSDLAVVLERHNASGLPQHDASVRIPVSYK